MEQASNSYQFDLSGLPANSRLQLDTNTYGYDLWHLRVDSWLHMSGDMSWFMTIEYFLKVM